MRIIVAIACVFALTTPAAAQYGVSNARDGNGNLVRDNGMNPSRNYGQAPVNNVNNAAPAEQHEEHEDYSVAA